MPEIIEGSNLGDLLKYEASHLYSRKQTTVAAGQHLLLGTVVGKETATSTLKTLDPTATDGTEIAAGVLAVDIDASLIERDDAILIARHAIVSHAALVWPAGITQPQKTTAIAQLESLGILVRQGV